MRYGCHAGLCELASPPPSPACGDGRVGNAEPSTPEKGPVANKKHLELGCGVPVVASLVRKMGGVPCIMEHFLCSRFILWTERERGGDATGFVAG